MNENLCGMKVQQHVFQQALQLILKQMKCTGLRKCFGPGLTSHQNDHNIPLSLTKLQMVFFLTIGP